MQPYKNKSKNSGVVAFQFGEDGIVVQFDNGCIYWYDNTTTGKNNIDEMKQLALQGEGLCTFINKNVKDKFAKKIR